MYRKQQKENEEAVQVFFSNLFKLTFTFSFCISFILHIYTIHTYIHNIHT